MYSAKQFSFKYPGQSLNLVNLNFKINNGDFVLIMGQSGSGKSTLLHHLCPSLIPNGQRSGELFYNGQSIDKVNEPIGFVFQNPDDQIVMDNIIHEIAFGLENINMPLVEMKQRVGEIVQFFNLQSLLFQPCDQLSGGQKQLLNLASIMAMNPQTIILDEPTSQLDPFMASTFLNMLKTIHEQYQTTIIIVEHRYEQLLSMCNKIIVLEKGTILSQGSPQDTLDFLFKTHHPLIRTLPDDVMFSQRILNPTQFKIFLSLHQFKTHFNDPHLSSQTILELKDVSYSFKENKVLQHCDLKINQHQITAILGGNGSGKSTLLNCIMGFNRYKGLITYQNHKLKDASIQIGLVPQDPRVLFVCDSIKDELSMFPIKEVENLLQTFNLMPYLNTHPYDLSGGYQQLLAFIKVVLLKPKILLLDELTKGLDGILKKQLGQFLHQLLKQDVTILMVSHDLEFCAKYANQCGLMFDGKVEAMQETRKFMSTNLFYTTQFAKLFKSVDADVIKIEDVELND